MMSLYNIFSNCSGVSIDSRTIQKDALFIALTGDNHDGHHYVESAFKQGAGYAIIDNPAFKINSRCILVDNTLQALQDLARYHRTQLTTTTVIAIVGSNGKTTTKNLIQAIFSSSFKTQATQGNLNNHIGVPLTILSLSQDCEFAVIEMGANHPGEHHLLCSIAQPHAGIITNCGKDHLEGYGSIEGVIDANCELYDYLRDTNGTIFVNHHEPILNARVSDLATIHYAHSDQAIDNVLTTGSAITLYPNVSLRLSHHTTMTTHSITIDSHLLGDFQINNMLSAACIGLYFKVSLEMIKHAIESYVPNNNRSQIIQWNSNTIILDAYNANPSSMTAMINYFSEYPAENKSVILGDMFELGDDSDKEHASIAALLKTKEFHTIILVGHLFKGVKDTLACYHVHDVNELKLFLQKEAYQNHVFLVKGSRGMALENAF